MSSIEERETEFLKERRDARLDSYRSSPEDITAHFSDEGQIQADYHKRFAFELIQNADDAMQGVEGEKAVRFEVRNGALLVANTGRPIDEEDVKALCTMSYTTKGADGEKRASIGHKGRGFSSVLEITNRPQIFSTGISFEFHEDRSRDEIEGLVEELDELSTEQLDGVPLMRLPFPPMDTPDRVQELLNEGYNTVFRFELKDEEVEKDVRETISSLDKDTVLFLQELERLELRSGTRDTEGWEIHRQSEEIDSDRTDLTFVTVRRIIDGEKGDDETFALFSRDHVEIGRHTGGIDENTWGDVNYTQIGLALRAKEREDGIHLTRMGTYPSVHVFLPTDERCPLPVLVNGAFHTAISRTNINVTADDDNYNGFLLDQVADLLATDVRAYVSQTATTIEEFIECLDFTHLPEERREDMDSLEGRFVDSLRRHFIDIEFVPQLERLATGEVLSDPGKIPLREVILPYYADEKPEMAEAVARIYGNEKVSIDGIDVQGRFPKTTLLEPSRAAILEWLGASVLQSDEVALILGAVPGEQSPLIPPDESDKLTIDPILQVMIWVWKSISGQEEQVDQFKEAANASAVFPVGEPDDGIVKHVACDEDTQFFLPPQNALPDVELSGIRFLTPPVYRPEESVEPARQKALVEDLRPALEAIWDVNEFDFEEVLRAAVFPKLPRSREAKMHDEELRDMRVLDLIQRMASESVDADNPLPFMERDGTLHRLCMLPVPTRDGDWQRAYQVYFGEEWQQDEPEEKRIEPLVESVDTDVAYLAAPEDLPGNVQYVEEGEDGEESAFDDWKRFFLWLGVAQHIKLTPLFDPMEQRNFTGTLGIERPGSGSVLSQLSDDSWAEYQHHLREKLDQSEMQHREYDSIYQMQGIEFFNRYVERANEDSDVAVKFFTHLVAWWEESLQEYRRPVLATHDVRSFGRRNKSCPKEREKRHVGQNLWLWQLKRAAWCPSNQGQRKPKEVWLPTESVTKRFSIQDVTFLPVLAESVLDEASQVRDFLHILGLRYEPSQSTFRPEDAEIVARNLVRMFEGEAEGDDGEGSEIADSLRQIKPVYRYLSELLPGLDPGGNITDDTWKDAPDRLQEIPVLCRTDDSVYSFEPSENAYFVRSPDVLDRIPIQGVPLFVLQEDEAARFGTYFGLKDLENEADSRPKYLEERDEKTENVQEFLDSMAPFILCRLEAERPSQELIDQDVNGMRSFVENIAVVDEIEVEYHFASGADETVIKAHPDYFLDDRGRGSGKRPLPFVRNTDDSEELNRFLARALCEYLGVSQFEGIITLFNAGSEERRLQYLKLAGAPATRSEVEGKRRVLAGEVNKTGILNQDEWWEDDDGGRNGGTQKEEEEDQDTDSYRQDITRRDDRTKRTHSVYDSGELAIGNDTITIRTEPGDDGDESSDDGEPSDETGRESSGGSGVSGSYRSKIDRLGHSITEEYERKRLQNTCDNPDDYVFDIHSEKLYEEAKNDEIAGPVLENLEDQGLPPGFPGFDILVVNPEDGTADRLIELKSSGHDTRTPGVTWNEWKTASSPEVRHLFYLYIVGNLRKDIQSEPYLKEIPNPFSLLTAETTERTEVTKEVKVDVTSFRKEAEIKETPLTVAEQSP